MLPIPRTNDFVPVPLPNVSSVSELKLLGVIFDVTNNILVQTH